MLTFERDGSRRPTEAQVARMRPMTPQQRRLMLGLPRKLDENDIAFARMCAELDSEAYAWTPRELKTARTSYTPEEQLQIAIRVGAYWRDDVRSTLGWPKSKHAPELTRERKKQLVRAMWLAGSPVAWIKEAVEVNSSQLRVWCGDLPEREGSPRGRPYKSGVEHGNHRGHAVPSKIKKRKKKMPVMTTPEMVKEMRRLRARGWSFPDIGLALDISHATAWKHARDVVIERPTVCYPYPKPTELPRRESATARIDDDTRAQIRVAYAGGVSRIAIARRYGISVSSVRPILCEVQPC
jgi:hypothetical protein